MNYSIIFYIIGWILNLEAAFMLPSCLVALIYQESSGWSLVAAVLLCLLIGLPLVIRKPKNRVFYLREGFTTTALCWIVLSCVGALPFVLSGYIPNPVDALFETVSGFTTTGASILTDVEALPHCLLFWRSFTHWIGGMGVLVFILCLLPLTGGDGGYHVNLMKAESPGPSVSKLVPQVQSTAKILYSIYLTLTVIEFVLLLFGKMSVFDALTTSFGTAGTGGFGIKNDSIAGYSPYIQYVVTIFMILFGINFSAYFLLLSKKLRQAIHMEEVRWYLIIIFASIVFISFNARAMFSTLEETIRHVSFQVASVITTTGFATTDFDLWPEFSRTILVILMFIGVFYFGLEAVLYTLLAFFVMFKTCNAFTDGFDYKKNIIIISEHYEEIGNGIIEVIGRGVTYLYAEGAYTHQQRKVLLVVAKLTQVAKIKQIVRDIDPGCFMIIQDANDVFGKGFTSKPSAHKKNKKIFCTVDTLKQKS